MRKGANLTTISTTLLITIVCLGGCASQPRSIYTASEAALAEPLGYVGIRGWIDGDVPNPREFGPILKKGNTATYLALSGGGGNGAYGAGILNGWTQSGMRPAFTAVSGVSTGALIAPFAFLGPAYDAQLKSVYTDGTAESLVQTPDFLQAAFGSSLFGEGRLLDLVSRYVDPAMIDAIAREQGKGRRLYVVTTNLDSNRGVVWNIGAIAASGRPDAVDLIRRILAASASVPLAFSPVLIDAQVDGHVFQEMHADGNVTTSVFTFPTHMLAAHKKTPLGGGKIYILMNTTIVPKFSVVENSTLKIAGASINALLSRQTIDGLIATYHYARANDIDFNLTAINPADASDGARSFDSSNMRKLYEIGYKTALRSNFWQKVPPLSDDGSASTERVSALQ